jgi:hypothetical protein
MATLVAYSAMMQRDRKREGVSAPVERLAERIRSVVRQGRVRSHAHT